MIIILFGFKNVGKSFLGKKLSKETGFHFIDTDILIEKAYFKDSKKKKTTSQIYVELQEEGFRSLEKRVILSLKPQENTIISLGGGAILDPENQAYLRNVGYLVYVEQSKEELRKRTYKNPPLFLKLQDRNAFENYYEKRKKQYESIPAFTLKVEKKSPKQVIALLKEFIYAQ